MPAGSLRELCYASGMRDRPGSEASTAHGQKQPGLDGRLRDGAGEIRRKRGDTLTLGLRAFEKISAVEGIRLSGEMRKDLRSLDARHMDEGQRSRFITGKYGKK